MNEKKRIFKILFFVLFSFILVLGITGCKSIGVSDGGGSTYSISGAVTGADLAGLAGVTINLTGAATASTTTDASGTFTFTGLAYGSYTVTPVKEGFTFTPTRQVKVVNGANITGVNFMATDSAYIYIPGAIFHEGPPPPASGISTDLVVTSATPSGSLYLNSSITWTVTWVVTTVTVTYVDLYIPELGGYFVYEVTPEEAVAGEAQLEMVKSFTLPPTESCTPPCGTCWCAVKAPEATTESLETSFSLVADGGSVGVSYLGGIGLHLAGCGDAVCEGTEDSFTCPGDCPVVCGNLICENGEDNSTCPGDCRTAVCGNAVCESGENSSTCPGDCRTELPVGFPSDVPVGTYTMICNGQEGGYVQNTDIGQFSQELVSRLESISAQWVSTCSGTGATCSYSLTFTPWNGTFFTMTYNLTVTACYGDQCSTVSVPITCSIEATK
ncbi:MAG: carboxypeptidase-like regulatory domain-containing protein [Anaerolineales bacterium]|nr:carboxypeptidase-like regulatory domain-containing protein [Anaerolineales bacterium]